MNAWPRLLEIALGVWLMASPSIVGGSIGEPATILSEVVLGAAIAVVAGASIKWEWVHWIGAPLALWVTLVPYFFFTRPGPALAQSDITTGLVLLMVFVLPTRATEAPAGWRG